MKIGVMGTGAMAAQMAGTFRQMNQVTCHAVASRSLEKAKKFAAEHGFLHAYGSYEELVLDKEVELIYIASPHSEHRKHMLLCIDHGKPVLCEKAFTLNAAEAREVAKAAEEKGVYVAEAIRPRYMPSRKLIDELLNSGIIGNVNILTANLSYVISGNQRITDPKLAGGALLDVGVYGINFALMHFGKEIERVESSVRMTETGVDGTESITLFYGDGRMAVLTHGIYARSDRKGIFYGDKGYMVVENINNPSEINVYDTEDRLIRHVDVPKQISGYEYEIDESISRILSGKTESVSMPLKESIRMMELMDSIRRDRGLVYPGEA